MLPAAREDTSPLSARGASLLERIAAPADHALPMPRMLIVLAHPDDEVLALGARLERLRGSCLLTVTDGAPRNGDDATQHGFPSLAAYRTARQQELLDALQDADLGPEFCYPGLEATGLPIADQTASLHMVRLAQAVAAACLEFTPDAVLTHPYEGGHPDHDACAFAVHTALRLLHDRGHGPLPAVMEAPFYHAGPGGCIETGVFLPAPGALVLERALSPEEQERKRRRLTRFHTQRETLQQFGTGSESFRLAPAYNFTESPHPGQLFYEQFPWGMTGDRFRARAATALVELGLAAASASLPPAALNV